MDLSARSLTKRFGPAPGYEAVREVDLELRAGEFISIVGRSGSGKSTLLALLGALARPTKGALLLDGTDVWSLAETELAGFRCRTIGFIFQFPSLLANLTAVDNVAVPALLGRTMDAETAYARAHDLIARVGLDGRADAYPGSLSGGEQRRVVIARALINSPRLLLADEPTSDLDEETEAGIMALLEDLRRSYAFGLVLVTHNLALARQARHVYEMRQGRLIAADMVDRVAVEVLERKRLFDPVEATPDHDDLGAVRPEVMTALGSESSEWGEGGKTAQRSAFPYPATERKPTATPERHLVQLGASLWRNVRALMIGAVAVFAAILVVDLAVARYQANQVRARGEYLAQLADLALARLQTEVQSVTDMGEGRYELAISLRNAGVDKPLYVLSPDMHAFVQVGKIWQEVPLQALGDETGGVMRIEGDHVYRYGFEVRVKDYTQLLPNYMHMRFASTMLVSPSPEPKGDIFERKDNYYVYLKPFDVPDDVVMKRMKFSGKPPVWIPMPPH